MEKLPWVWGCHKDAPDTEKGHEGHSGQSGHKSAVATDQSRGAHASDAETTKYSRLLPSSPLMTLSALAGSVYLSTAYLKAWGSPHSRPQRVSSAPCWFNCPARVPRAWVRLGHQGGSGHRYERRGREPRRAARARVGVAYTAVSC